MFSEIHDMLPVQIDENTTAGVTYVRYVKNGLNTDAAANNSAILRYEEITPGLMNIGWAGGSKEFIYQWSLRASYTYSPLKR